MKLHEIPTPALIVDLPAMQRNIDRMAAYFAGRTSKLRPHFKAHKTPAIAKRQLAAGNCTGLTCATVGEAEVVVRERLCDEILIANEIVGPGKAARAANLAGQASLIVAVDSDYGLDDIAAAARRRPWHRRAWRAPRRARPMRCHSAADRRRRRRARRLSCQQRVPRRRCRRARSQNRRRRSGSPARRGSRRGRPCRGRRSHWR